MNENEHMAVVHEDWKIWTVEMAVETLDLDLTISESTSVTLKTWLNQFTHARKTYTEAEFIALHSNPRSNNKIFELFTAATFNPDQGVGTHFVEIRAAKWSRWSNEIILHHPGKVFNALTFLFCIAKANLDVPTKEMSWIVANIALAYGGYKKGFAIVAYAMSMVMPSDSKLDIIDALCYAVSLQKV